MTSAARYPNIKLIGNGDKRGKPLELLLPTFNWPGVGLLEGRLKRLGSIAERPQPHRSQPGLVALAQTDDAWEVHLQPNPA